MFPLCVYLHSGGGILTSSGTFLALITAGHGMASRSMKVSGLLVDVIDHILPQWVNDISQLPQSYCLHSAELGWVCIPCCYVAPSILTTMALFGNSHSLVVVVTHYTCRPTFRCSSSANIIINCFISVNFFRV